MNDAQALLFHALLAVTGLVLGAVLSLTPMEAVRIGALAMAFTLSAVLPALRDDPNEDGTEHDR